MSVNEAVAKLEEPLARDILENIHDGVYYVDRTRRILSWNRAAKRITGYSGEEVVGRRCMDGILMHVDEAGCLMCRGMCPLADTIADGQLREKVLYLHHKEGHRVPVLLRTAPVQNPEGVIVGAVEIFCEETSVVATRAKLEELQQLAFFDSLTGVGNRRYLEINLAAKLEELKRHGWPFGVLFIDLDHFKRVNDTFGHAAGDEVLKMVGRTLAFGSRSADAIGRWGGEEFVVIAVNAEAPALVTVAERIRVLVEQSVLEREDWKIRVSVSIGATAARPGDTCETLMARADQRLYKSKSKGRNRNTFD